MSYIPVTMTPVERFMRSFVQHYEEKKYWKRRSAVIDPNSRVPKLLRMYYLYYIKRCDSFNNASLGTHMGFGTRFKGTPTLVHGLYGIIISHNASIGTDCTIYHQVTIGNTYGGAPTIGDHVTIGAGAKIMGNVKIGNNVTIGANAVVVHDVPDNTVVVAPEGVILRTHST